MVKHKEKIIKTKTLAIKLVYKQWHHHFSKEVRKILIAESLNKAVSDKDLKIHGYLIMETKMYLLVEKRDEITETLESFYYFLKNSLIDYFKKKEQHSSKFHMEFEDLNRNLFLEQKLYDKNLELLLTGRKINKPYHDPNLLKLKAVLKQTKYCSTIDYSGGISPVIISKMDVKAT